MEATRPAPLNPAGSETAQRAKAALRRLAQSKLEPTPENYARAWRQEGPDGASAASDRSQRVIERVTARIFDADADSASAAAAEFALGLTQGRWDQVERALQQAPVADGSVIASLIERIVRGVERGSRGWTAARKKESLQRVLGGSRSDARRLQQRLGQLVASWDSAAEEGAAAESLATDGAVAGEPLAPPSDGPVASVAANPLTVADAQAPAWQRAVGALGGTVGEALPARDATPHEIASGLAVAVAQLREDGADAALADEIDALCARALPVLQHRHHLVEMLGGLCTELTASLTDLAENDSWAKGQCEAMQVKIGEGLSARGVRAVSELLRDTRERQGLLRAERERARDSLKGMINRMLSELDQLGSQTGHFHESVGRYADVIEKADTLESLAGVVHEMVEESRTVQALVQQTQARLHEEHSKARALSERVGELEAEMRRLSDEVSTDQLTQIANRRGLMQAFDTECAKQDRQGNPLAVGLLDIDNFKRLNDELGHSAGDEALKSLAALIRKTLRPGDHVARFGGEEFVVLLPDTPADEGQQILTRLQRALTGGLFMHEDKQVFVTFSAGVTAYRVDETLETALERADQALYLAKRTGKNRTCIG